ncbi:MAG TPA: alkaline phosphatase D family protein [Candidatus Polarisedimenticolaceae bacterium]|nr:alkaline phosphatase D family protein [Candidatus Polarisedimenticolaceae bacterium]
MSITRRDFLTTAAIASAAGFVRLRAETPAGGRRVFLHGVASGDPLADRVILWTRVTAPPGSSPAVAWELAADPAFRRVVTGGSVPTGDSRDFTVKIDAGPLDPATSYYYRFEALGERSPVGRTRTLPAALAPRIRLALASCSNLPFGYFNVYARIAARSDLDAVLHLGDYIYEYENGRYGDGTALGRVPEPDRELVSLADYRARYAQYRRDADLQEVHRQHPFIVVWDDHEVTNNTWRDGADNHQPDLGEGDWSVRKAAAVRAYLEWMPIRADRATRRPRIYRSFAFGDLADLLMLDTRVLDRDRQAASRDAVAVIDDPARTLLGAAQEQWLVEELVASRRAAVQWQLLGQQVMFAPGSLPGAKAASVDTWDGYRPARDRLMTALAANDVRTAIVLTGDIHSSWAYDLPRDPWSGYDATTGRGSLGVEIVVPAVTSPSGLGPPDEAAERIERLKRERPHLKFLEASRRGYVVLDVTRGRVQADWFFVPTVTERVPDEEFGGAWLTEAGDPHLIAAATPAPPGPIGAEPAPL